MKKLKSLIHYFSPFELILWIGSVSTIVLFFLLFDKENYFTLISSLIGVTSLIFSAKGNPFGQVLMIIFSTLYGIISFGFSYYGEVLTYIGMTLPMSVFALISWLRNPFKGKKSEVAVNRINKREIPLMLCLTLAVTVVFYFILERLNTANIIPSTISVATSFLAVYLSFRRSPYFALAYASNDIVLVTLWILATIKEPSYISVTVCFAIFLINDLYGFINWQKMKKRQEKSQYETPQKNF